jgi:hypothetical protein
VRKRRKRKHSPLCPAERGQGVSELVSQTLPHGYLTHPYYAPLVNPLSFGKRVKKREKKKLPSLGTNLIIRCPVGTKAL